MPRIMPEGFEPRARALAVFDECARNPGRWCFFDPEEISARWSTVEQFRNSCFKAAKYRGMKATTQLDLVTEGALWVKFLGDPIPELFGDPDD